MTVSSICITNACFVLGSLADAESLLRRFTRASVQHPAYKALTELGKALNLLERMTLETWRP